MRCRSQSPVKCSNLDYLTILTPPKRIYPKGDSRTKNTMTEYEKVKDFLEWADREIPKEKDEKLKQAMERIKKLIIDRLREKGEL